MSGATDKNTETDFFRKNTIPHGRALFALCMAAVVLIAVIFALFFGARQKEPEVQVHAENRFEKTLRVVTDIDYEPFSYIGTDGGYAGLDVELIAEVANRLQMNLDFVLLDWTAANELFNGGGADVFLNMETDSVAASGTMIATIPTAEKQYVVYGRRAVQSVAELYGTRVASLHHLPELGLDADITYLDSYAQIFSALSNGDFDFAICPIQVGNVFLQKMSLTDIKPSYAVSHIYGAMALHTGDEALRDGLNAVLAQLWREGFMDALDKKWVSHRYQNASLALILRENPWIIAALFLLLIALAFLAVSFVFQTRSAKEREAYTMRLKENLDTINQQQAELIEAKTKAEASSRAKTLFLSNMSHDIRTPMNAIIGYTTLARKPGTDAAEIQGFLEKIDSSSKQLLALINDVLEMSRIESGKLELEETECDLCAVMAEAHDMFATQMAQKNIAFMVNADNLQNPLVLCDKNRLNRVLLNLISNAYKFTPQDGAVSVTLRQTGPAADGIAGYEFCVKDNGIGMSKEFAERVFDAFERERTSTVSGIQGTGLGMAITKSILDLIGGTIEVHTEQGKGTEFVIDVHFRVRENGGAALGIRKAAEPFGSEERSDERTNGAIAEPVVARPERSEGNAPKKTEKRILLVDDVEVNREIAAMLLGDMGFVVEIAVNGKEAVEKVSAADTGYYVAVLMDIQMPVMDGYEAARQIRGLGGKKAEIPVIAMTANAFAEDVQKATEAGMDAHIAKPIDLAVMTKTLQEVLGQDLV